jgi:hypothetical protein
VRPHTPSKSEGVVPEAQGLISKPHREYQSAILYHSVINDGISLLPNSKVNILNGLLQGDIDTPGVSSYLVGRFQLP